MEGDEPLPDDLRCKRTDGRDWRCKRRVADGKSLCETHLYRGQKLSPNPNPKPKPRVRIKLRVKPEPVEDDLQHEPTPTPAPGSNPVPDHLRCHRNDGRSWRCKRQAIEGQTLCEIHHSRTQNQNQKRPRKWAPPLREEREDLNSDPSPVPENLRCSRNSGQGWRCKRQAVEGQTLCEIHRNRAQNQRRPRMPENGSRTRSPVPENLRCSRTNGKDWRCKRQVMEGHTLCQLHFNKLKVKSTENYKPSDFPIPEDLRCMRNDGREWRCKRQVMEGQTLCEAHFKKLKIRGPSCNEEKDEQKPSRKENKESTPVPEFLRCPHTDSRERRCTRRVMEGETLCRIHFKKAEAEAEAEAQIDEPKVESVPSPLPQAEELDLLCKRTDGRGWRCKRRVCEGKTLCEIHYEQGRLRQMRVTVPESLKIKRGEGVKTEKRLKRKRALEKLESNSDKGMKRMKAELIRVFLRREIIERSKKSEKGCDNGGEVTRDLPYGLMAIPPASPTEFLENAGSLGIKVGAQSSNSTVNRRFRSKNIEPPPITTSKIVPYVGNAGKVKSSGKKKCHWCRKSDKLILTKCSSCSKRFFCSNCIKERCTDSQEIELRCPVCCGSCDCKACATSRSKDEAPKEILKELCKRSKFQHLLYLINFLLPILEKINKEQSVEVEMEAKVKGQNLSEVEIQQADVGCRERCSCNNCKSPILDFHRSCPNCSYNLCLSCCREYSRSGSIGFNGSCSLKKCQDKIQRSSSVQSMDKLRISCPPMELGGCDNSLLDLRCIFPLNWTKELEISAKEVASEHDLQISKDSVRCLLCANITQEADRIKELQEASRRKDSDDNFLYSPSTCDDHDNLLAHFQIHWRKGHPVKVRNVIQGASNSCWDPLAMFCSYLEKGFSNSEKVKDSKCSDWYEVEIGTKESYAVSLEAGYSHIKREAVKVKAKFSSVSCWRLFEGHYGEIIHDLPLQEYTNPRSGLLNLAGKLPEDFPDSKLGPQVCISCGSSEEVARGELVTKLSYNSYDVVNILVHASDAACSMEQLNKIKKLIRTNNANDKGVGGCTSHNAENEESRMQREVSVEECIEGTPLSHGVVPGTSCCSGATNDDKSPAKVNGSDTDSDASMICSRTSDSPEKSVVDQITPLDRLEISDKRLPPSDPCGAQWDVFRREDIPKLLEYITKHVDELSYGYDLLPKNVVHSIFDGSFYLDAIHKMRLKEEFEIEPWTFNQCLGEAVFIPAGCLYQIRNIKSCVNIALGFISPENASECIKLMEEIRVLPNSHKAKQEKPEVEKMAICSIDEAIKEIYRLMMSDESRH